MQNTPRPNRSLDTTLDELRSSLEVEHSYSRWVMPMVVAAMLVALLGLSLWWDRNRPADKPSVYVAPPEDGSLWQHTALTRLLVAQLSGNDGVTVVNPVLRAGYADDTLMSQLADVTLVSELLPAPEASGYLLKVRLSRPDSPAHELTTLQVQANFGDMNERTQEVLTAFWQVLGVSGDRQRELDTGDAIEPRELAVRRLLAEAESAMRVHDQLAAIDRLEQARRLNPNHPVVLLYLSRVHASLGMLPQARTYARNALLNAETLPRALQLAVEAHALTHEENWQQAIPLLEALRAFYPRSVEYAVDLVALYRRAGRTGDALDTTRQLRAVAPRTAGDPRLSLADAETLRDAGRYDEAHDAARATMTLARSVQAQRIFANAVSVAVHVDKTMSPTDAEALLETALAAAAGNPTLEAKVLVELANRKFQQGDLAASMNYAQSAVEVASRAGSQNRLASAQNTLARTLDLQGSLREGLELKQQVLAYFLRNQRADRIGLMYENVAISQRKLGDLADASNSLTLALDAFTVSGDQIGIAWVPFYRAVIARLQGDYGGAERLARVALDNAVTRPEGNLALMAREELAELALMRSDLDEARQLADALYQGFDAQGEQIYLGHALVMQARVEALRGETGSATSLVARALDIALDNKAPRLALHARTHAVLIAEPDAAECRTLESEAQQMQEIAYRLPALLSSVRCLARAGEMPLRVGLIRSRDVFDAAARAGMLPMQLAALDTEAELWRLAGREVPPSVEERRTHLTGASQG